MFIILITCLLLLASTATSERTAVPISNPHSSSKTSAAAACMCPAQLINPHEIIAVAPGKIQSDTFLALETAKVNGGVSVPLYNFRQPARLSSLQLPFKILLVNKVGAGAVALPVHMKQAQDSWFEGYFWDVLVCESSCNDSVSDSDSSGVTHIGWKFNSITNPSESFYALIVRTNEDTTQRSGENSVAEALREYLSVGQPASLWILGLLATHHHQISL